MKTYITLATFLVFLLALVTDGQNTPAPTPRVYDCGTSGSCSGGGTYKPNTRVLIGSVALNGSGAAAVSVKAFTSSTSFRCMGVDQTNQTAVKITNPSSSQFNITGGASDTVSFVCAGY